jgi:tripartite-type tricarboxylate transporter receptor subunit TctC
MAVGAAALPAVPRLARAQAYPSRPVRGFQGIGAPRNTPAETIATLNKELNAGLANSKIKARIVDLGGTVLGGSPEEFGAIISEATKKWAKAIKFAGVTAD